MKILFQNAQPQDKNSKKTEQLYSSINIKKIINVKAFIKYKCLSITLIFECFFCFENDGNRHYAKNAVN